MSRLSPPRLHHRIPPSLPSRPAARRKQRDLLPPALWWLSAMCVSISLSRSCLIVMCELIRAWAGSLSKCCLHHDGMPHPLFTYTPRDFESYVYGQIQQPPHTMSVRLRSVAPTPVRAPTSRAPDTGRVGALTGQRAVFVPRQLGAQTVKWEPTLHTNTARPKIQHKPNPNTGNQKTNKPTTHQKQNHSNSRQQAKRQQQQRRQG
jgi:hypothetical protein